MKSIITTGLALALCLTIILPFDTGAQAQMFKKKWRYKYYPKNQKHLVATGYGAFILSISCKNKPNSLSLALLKANGGYEAELFVHDLKVWVDGQKIKPLLVVGNDADWIKKENHFRVSTFIDFEQEVFAAVSRFRDARRNITLSYKSHKVTFPARGSTKALTKLFAKCQLPRRDKKPGLLQ